jgi:D-tagatose-1,6-bisphosphate aldolase subunit GatZ/KbaZ
MLRYPGYWEKYYRGSEAERALKRKHSLSDRARYYWAEPEVQDALRRLRSNLQSKRVPRTLMRQFAPLETEALIARGVPFSTETVVSESISMRLQGYFAACRPGT